MAHNSEFHILFAIKGLGGGGAERWLTIATRWLVERNILVTVANLNPALDHLREVLMDAGATVIDYDVFSWRGISEFYRLVRKIATGKISLIHAHLPMAGVVARLAGALSTVPVVYTEHNVVESYSKLTGCLNRATYFMDARNTAVSECIARSIAKVYGGRSTSRLDVIENPIDLGEVAKATQKAANVRQEYSIPDDHIVVGTVASFRAVKRLDLLLAAFAKLHAIFPNTSLLMVGAGPEYASLVALSEKFQIDHVVKFTGFRSNPLHYTAALDVFVLCSDWEGMPMALLEAMATGRAVVATAIAGTFEIVEHEQTGLLVAPRSVEALVSAIALLIQNPDRRNELGRKAASVVSKRHDREVIMQKYFAIYLELDDPDVDFRCH